MVPDLRAIESRTEVAASQINRREGATEGRRERRERKKKEKHTKRRDERKRETEEDDAMSAGAEDAFHSAESERRAR